MKKYQEKTQTARTWIAGAIAILIIIWAIVIATTGQSYPNVLFWAIATLLTFYFGAKPIEKGFIPFKK